MPKSQIIKDVVEGNASLEKSLNRLLVLAMDVKNEHLEQWVKKELNGYSSIEEVPEYRKTKCRILQYSGINGSFRVTNVPLPNGFIDKKILDDISDISICDGILQVCEMAESEESPTIERTWLSGIIYEASGGGISCASIQQIIPQQVFKKICAEVKSKMIVALVELEKKYGCLDDLGIDISDKKEIQIVSDNNELNRAVFNINVPSVTRGREPWYSKIAWNIVTPIITGVLGAVIAAIIIRYIKI